MKKFLYAIVALMFFAGAIYSYELPIGIDNPDNDSIVLEGEFESLPNADFVQNIKESLNIKDYEGAIDLANVGMEIFPDDVVAMENLRNNALENDEFKKSPMGKAYAFAKGFATGEVDDIESGAGSIAGDMFVWGDIRDLTKEIVFEDDPDELIILLSGIGVATSVAPTLDMPISVAKTMKKISSLSQSMINILIEKLKLIKNPASLAAVKELKNLLMPMADLYKQSKSFSQFKLLLKACKDNSAVKFITTLGANSKKSLNDLGQIMAVIGSKNTKMAQNAMDYVIKTKGSGIDVLKKGLKKGRRGIECILKNPNVVKATRKVKILSKYVPVIWKTLAKNMPIVAKYIRMGLTSLCSALGAFFSLRFISLLLGKRVDQNPVAKATAFEGNATSVPLPAPHVTMPTPYRHTPFGEEMLDSSKSQAFMALAVFLAVACVMGFSQFIDFTPPTFGVGGNSIPPDSNPLVNVIIAFLLGVFVVLLFMLSHRIKADLIAIWNNQNLNPKQKLSLIENLDIWFDLPLYGGLAMTILAFILICFSGVTSARYMAYTATLAGIVCTAWMRIRYLHRIKRELLLESSV